MKTVRIAYRICFIVLAIMLINSTNVLASLTKEQAEDVAMFATTFIEKGNERRDENGYPLLVYALSANYKTSVEIRRKGYFGELYHVKNNNYHMKNGKYLDLGLKWCMDCGDFISYVYKVTLGLDMYLEAEEDPWHIKDMYADANRYENSKYLEFVYKNVPISKIEESKLQKGDLIIRMGSKENHGLIYVEEGMMAAHASRNAIKYSKNPPILGFEVVKFDRFYKKSTVVSILRIKEGIIDENTKVNSTIVWPDTMETQALLLQEEKMEHTTENNVEMEYIYNIEYADKKAIDVIEDKTLYDGYFRQVLKLNQNSDYIEEQIFDWIIYELKKFLIQLFC